MDIEEVSAVLDGRYRLVNPEYGCPKCYGEFVVEVE